MKKKTDKETIQASLTKLENIAQWFEKEETFDIEEGLKKVKEGAALVREIRQKLTEVENEFQEIQQELTERS